MNLELTDEGLVVLSMIITMSVAYWVIRAILISHRPKPTSKAKEKPDEDDDSAD